MLWQTIERASIKNRKVDARSNNEFVYIWGEARLLIMLINAKSVRAIYSVSQYPLAKWKPIF
ncbi:hypothetical protein M3226_21060 [Neobacillus cucumis]|uniref:hypothetical protein n=1 Tax=Neobacillus cucumis TaxID=1740721 RepID=UPI00203E2FA3|nr:hypothetical protein [Neobacillus cucumis]MCM3728143.1 hypothetical protein [Neobacillus cucumis]